MRLPEEVQATYQVPDSEDGESHQDFQANSHDDALDAPGTLQTRLIKASDFRSRKGSFVIGGAQ